MNKTAAGTLADIEALIKARKVKETDYTKFPIIEHMVSGVKFRAAPMSGEKYEKWQGMLHFEDLKYENQVKQGFPADRTRSNTFLFRNALLTESGEDLTDEVVDYFLKAENYGPSNAYVLSAAQIENPPRYLLVAEVEHAYGFCRSLIVLVRILEKAGCLELLRDRLSLKDDEAKQKAIAELNKWLEGIEYWEVVLKAEDAAQALGISIYEAAENNSKAIREALELGEAEEADSESV